jgi:hypothetical protein
MFDRSLKIITAACFIVFFAVSFYKPIEFEDGWWHLATGRWIVEHGQVPHEDPFAFTEERSPWVLTQWLGSTLYYLSYLCGGYEGVKLFRAFLFLGIIGIFLFYSRRQLPFPLLVLLGFFLYGALQTRCLIRPDVFNYIFIQVFLIGLFAYSRDRDPKQLWILSASGCLWGNLHLGSFVFGGLLLGLGVLGSAVQTLRAYLNKQQEVSRWARDLKLFAVTLGVYLISLAVSPYGIEALIYPFKVFLFSNFINFYQFNNVVVEQLPPTYIFSRQGLWACALIAGGLAALFAFKRHRLLPFLLFIFPLFMFLQGRRASAFFALAAVYVIVECARQRSWKAWWDSWRHARTIERLSCVVFIFLFIMPVVQWTQNTVYTDGVVHKAAALDVTPRNPLSAVRFLLDEGMQGRVFTNDVVGGYVLWAAYPQLKPFVDGRQMDQRSFAQYLRILRLGPQQWDDIDREHRFDIVLLDTSLNSSYALAEYLFGQSAWKLVFIDGPTFVYARRDGFQFSVEAASLDDHLRSVAFSQEDIKTMRQLAAAEVSSKESWPAYVDLLEEGASLFGVGFRGEGVRRVLQGYPINPRMGRGVIAGIETVLAHEMQ